MVKPISPQDVTGVKKALIPPEVIAAFNALIVKNFSGSYASFRLEEVQKEILDRMMEAGCEKSRDAVRRQMFDEHWLDVEDIFREVGWEVRYDAPGYCETGPSTFEFRKKKKK